MRKQTLTAILVTQLMASAAWAQSAPAANNAEGEFGTADIVVTAQKRSERLQDVPIAVNVVSGDTLASAGVTDPVQLSTVVPGLNATQTVGAFAPSIRGISTASNVVENPVAIYIDGVYMANSREGLRDLGDVSQIAVLKGPQGTLFGRNATAGVLQITTRGPDHDAGGEVRAGYDNYGTFKGNAFLTGGLSDSVAASLFVGYQSQSKGWGESVVNGMDVYKVNHSFTGRAKLRFEPSDRTDILLIGDYVDRDETGRVYQPYKGTTYLGIPYPPLSSRYDTYSTTPGWSRFKSRGISLSVEQDLDFAKLVSISAYRRGTGGFRFDFVGVQQPYVISTGEVQLISPSGGRLQWVAGLYYIYSEIGYASFPRVITNFPVGPFAPLARIDGQSEESTKAIAPFAQVDFKLTDATTLTVGGRWTRETRKITGANSTTLVSGVVIRQPAYSPGSLTVSKPTWRAALAHQFSQEVSVYASYNRGIKSGGFNIATPQAPPYLQEKLDAFELGFKSQLLDRRLTFNASAFFYKYGNLQVQTFIGGPTPVITNGAKAEMYGVDADFQFRASDAITLRGGAQLMHSSFTDYGKSCNPASGSTVGCAPISSINPAGGSIISPGDATGNRLPLSQNFVANLAVDFKQDIGEIKAKLNLTGAYNSNYYFEADNLMRQPSYVTLNSSLRLSDASDRLSLTFAVSNILNESRITNASTQYYAFFVNYAAEPRIYSVTAGLKF